MFILFGGEAYYAKGGLNDFEGTFSTLEGAISWAQHKEQPYQGGWDWWQIVTLKEGVVRMVARTECTPHGADDEKFVAGVQILKGGEE